jgi:hypothetical protein
VGAVLLWFGKHLDMVVPSVIALLALVVTYFMWRDGRKNTAASQKAAKAAEDTAAEEREMRLIEERRRHEEREPDFDVVLTHAGGTYTVDLLWGKSPQLVTVEAVIEQTHGYALPLYVKGPNPWTFSEVRDGGKYRMEVSKPDETGGRIWAVCKCRTAEGEEWTVTRTLDIRAVGAGVRLHVERVSYDNTENLRIINDGDEEALDVVAHPDAALGAMAGELPNGVRIGPNGAFHPFFIAHTAEYVAPTELLLSWKGSGVPQSFPLP